MIFAFTEGQCEGFPLALTLVRPRRISVPLALALHSVSDYFPHLFFFIIHILEILRHLLIYGDKEKGFLPAPTITFLSQKLFVLLTLLTSFCTACSRHFCSVAVQMLRSEEDVTSLFRIIPSILLPGAECLEYILLIQESE